MSEEVLATFTVKRLSVLDEQGNLDRSLMPELSTEQIRHLYELMVLARTFDERALNLQREGRLGTYPSILGQEAAQVGSAFALHPADWVFPAFRETGVQIALGLPMARIFQYWSGDERGARSPEELNLFPICVGVGTHIPHAVGAALAAKYRRDPVAAVAYFGDGATSKGDFHEGLNLAGVLKLPAVFICQNNQWAISVPVRSQTASASIAQKALAYGFDGVQVDGNDVFAVYLAVQRALERARSGGGPSFIECLTYRVADHTTADDAARYRSPEEVAVWRDRDPIARLERYLAKEGLFTDGFAKEVKRRSNQAVDEAVREMEAQTAPQLSDLFQYTMAELSPRQTEQLKEKELSHGAD